jgi:hypothetical protein
MILLLMAGIGFVLAGLLAILFGVPVKEFSFGNTLILSGVVAGGTGAILLGLYAAVRELKSIAAGVAVGAPATAARVAPKLRLPTSDNPDAGETAAGKEVFLFPRDQPAPKPAAQDIAPPSSGPDATPAPWQQEAAARDRTRDHGAVPPPENAPPAEPAVKPRRNLLFSSSSRKERERLAKAGDSVFEDPAAAEAPDRPEGLARSPEPPPRTFEEAWPESERARADVAMRRSRPAGDVSEAATPPERPAVTVPAAETTQVTVLKSGVVDGMAYSLYSDGSIEAQMPEGMMRFASIDELRSHLDQRP